MKTDFSHIDEILASYDYQPHYLIAILQDIQNASKYLSQDALIYIADKLGLSIAKVYSVATFYENFSLEAKGKYTVRICNGTACHVRKSQPIYNRLYQYLGLAEKRKTSKDGLFTLETVACLGACSLAPAMTVNNQVYAKMTPDAAVEILEEIRRKEASEA